jgi:hypothetical protein
VVVVVWEAVHGLQEELVVEMPPPRAKKEKKPPAAGAVRPGCSCARALCLFCCWLCQGLRRSRN